MLKMYLILFAVRLLYKAIREIWTESDEDDDDDDYNYYNNDRDDYYDRMPKSGSPYKESKYPQYDDDDSDEEYN